MFGYTIIKTTELEKLKLSLCIKEKRMRQMAEENYRLFDHHNTKANKPRRDKNGALHDSDGKFVKKKS